MDTTLICTMDTLPEPATQAQFYLSGVDSVEKFVLQIEYSWERL